MFSAARTFKVKLFECNIEMIRSALQFEISSVYGSTAISRRGYENYSFEATKLLSLLQNVGYSITSPELDPVIISAVCSHEYNNAVTTLEGLSLSWNHTSSKELKRGVILALNR